ncbi:MAG: hypothetical protein ABI210_08160, partial [Abditibacteriaceae bacterium]
IKKDVNSQLRPLMNASCDFTVAQAKDVLAVPSEAIRAVGEKSMVTVIKDPKKPLWEKSNQEQRVVTLGVAGDNLTQVTSGLKNGDVVVTKITLPPSADAGSGGSGGPGGSGGSGKSGGGGRGLGRF